MNEDVARWLGYAITVISCIGSMVGAIILHAILRVYKGGEMLLGAYALQPLRIFYSLAIFSIVLNIDLFVREQVTQGATTCYDDLLWDILKVAWTLNTTYFFGILLLQREERKHTNHTRHRRETSESEAKTLVTPRDKKGR